MLYKCCSLRSLFLQFAMLPEQSSEGTGSSGGIAKSGKRKLNVKSIEDKYQAILEVEKANKSKSRDRPYFWCSSQYSVHMDKECSEN